MSVSDDPAKDTPYCTDKLRWHPEVLERMRQKQPQPAPVQVHFMPMLACNQHCAFCAYGHRLPGDPEEAHGWKNMALMDETKMLSWPKALECIDDFEAMGVKALEITGGGEPLIWPHIDKLLNRLRGSSLETSLVTNGTALTAQRAKEFGRTNWKWARVSIDAGTAEQYVITRRVSLSHWKKAWHAVSLLAEQRFSPDQRVGVGFVVDRSNFSSIYAAAARAREYGADNIRISLCFSPQGLHRFEGEVLTEAIRQAREAKEKLSGGRFQVVNLLEERILNLLSPRQNYRFCAVKEVLCVVGGDSNVYTCCTLAFHPKGLIGSIMDQSFKSLWRSAQREAFFAQHDARSICTMECLYERRNQVAQQLLRSREGPDELPEPPPHVNFI